MKPLSYLKFRRSKAQKNATPLSNSKIRFHPPVALLSAILTSNSHCFCLHTSFLLYHMSGHIASRNRQATPAFFSTIYTNAFIFYSKFPQYRQKQAFFRFTKNLHFRFRSILFPVFLRITSCIKRKIHPLTQSIVIRDELNFHRFKAIPHKGQCVRCAVDFSSDCLMTHTGLNPLPAYHSCSNSILTPIRAYWRMSRDFWAR